MDYSKLTDREVDVEVAKRLGCEPNINEFFSFVNDKFVKKYTCTCDGYVHTGEKSLWNYDDLKKYSSSWQHAGPLLEMMKGYYPAVSFLEIRKIWQCGFDDGKKTDGLAESKSPTRAICEAYLEWESIKNGEV